LKNLLRSLHNRILFLILIPIFFLLAGIGTAGFLYARNLMVTQWGEIATANLRDAVHLIDMRLTRPKEMLLMLNNTSALIPDVEQNNRTHQFIISQLENIDGVVEVNVKWPEQLATRGRKMGGGGASMLRGMRFSRMEKFSVSMPEYNTRIKGETISLSTSLKDENDKVSGHIEVVIAFHDLIDIIVKNKWWQSNKAFLIDNNGKILSSTVFKGNGHSHKEKQTFAISDTLEIQTLAALQKKEQGIIFGPGHPPDEISGFFRMNEAPWSLVVIAPGRQVLKPILKFKWLFTFAGIFSILIFILLIRTVFTKTTRSIKKVSDAAKELADGRFGAPIPVLSSDEVGELTQNFNTMTRQLKDGLRLKKALSIAKEVQENLLPPPDFTHGNIQISAASISCEETGGDFFDIIQLPDKENNVCAVVGDVVGHGIGAALLMTTTRALLRSALRQNPSCQEALTLTNQLLCQDTMNSGSFVTLFLMAMDTEEQSIHWVRAGHDAALLYNPVSQSFEELKGPGIVLGLDDTWEYSENIHKKVNPQSICFIGTDGAWDSENQAGERFGKQRIKDIIQTNSHLTAKEIIDTIILEIQTFGKGTTQEDDITLMVIKFE
jgi:sigma-B regulation protein RsbU (phosphoserine phosphatase)